MEVGDKFFASLQKASQYRHVTDFCLISYCGRVVK